MSDEPSYFESLTNWIYGVKKTPKGMPRGNIHF